MEDIEILDIDIEFVKTMGKHDMRVEPYPGKDWQNNPGSFETSDYVYKLTDLAEISKHLSSKLFVLYIGW